jgi:capsid protein
MFIIKIQRKNSMESLNMSAVNQKARQALQEMNEELCLTSLYSVQLVNVLLSKGELEAEEDVVQTVRAMMTWRPERIVNFLLIAPEAEYNPSGWEKAKDHRELARILLADIQEKMIRHFPWYRSGEE